MARVRFSLLLPIENLSLVGDAPRSLALVGKLRLSNSPTLLRQLVSPALLEYGGSHLRRRLARAKVFAFLRGIHEVTSTSDVMDIPLEGLWALHTLDVFSFACWLRRDNAVAAREVFHQVHLPGGRITVGSAMVLAPSSTAMMNTQRLRLRVAEINQCCRRTRSLRPLENRRTDATLSRIRISLPDAFVDRAYGQSRLQRAIHSVQHARRAPGIEEKLLHYTVALEALTTSAAQAEVTHQISERTAILLGSSRLDPLRVYDFVKDLYAARSAVAHGGEVSRRLRQRLGELAVTVDGYLRIIIGRLLQEDRLAKVFLDDSNHRRFFMRKLLVRQLPLPPR